jgi:phthiodiolone/phenolphthiodiolone dimycocerosates ketoreductase
VADPCIHSQVAPDLVLRSTRALAATTGADAVFLPDHLIGVIPRSIYTAEHVAIKRLVPDLDACYEPWTVLGHLAARTGLRRVRLGTACTDTVRRHPAVTAQAAATLHQLSKGRAILGIGAGEGMNQVPYGIAAERRVARFEEAIATIRALWDSDGGPVSRDSPYYPLRDAMMAVPPYRGTRPEIWIGAHGPRMRGVAGRLADAWLPGVTMHPAQYGEHLAGIRDAAADAGRDPMSITAAKYFFVVTAASPSAVEDILAAPVVRSYALCVSSEHWRRHGAEHPLGAGFCGVNDLMPHTMDAATALEYTRQVPQSLLREVTLAGTPAQILEQLAEWRDQGLTYPLLLNMGLLQPDLRAGVLSNVAFARALRGIRKLGRRPSATRRTSPHPEDRPDRAQVLR